MSLKRISSILTYFWSGCSSNWSWFLFWRSGLGRCSARSGCGIDVNKLGTNSDSVTFSSMVFSDNSGIFGEDVNCDFVRLNAGNDLVSLNLLSNL